MTEYISREAVMSKCDDIWNNADETTQTGVDTINTIDEITDFIESLPIADVQTVKHGYWTDLNNDAIYHYECSCCKGHTDWHENFCPNCGAKMDGEQNENN